MSENSQGLARGTIEDLVKMQKAVKAAQDRDEDLNDFFERTEPVIDPDTEEEHWLDEGYGIEVRRQVCVTLAGGGPAMRLVATYRDDDTEPTSVEIQHQDWFTPWIKEEPEDGVEEDALDWYAEVLNLSEWARHTDTPVW